MAARENKTGHLQPELAEDSSKVAGGRAPGLYHSTNARFGLLLGRDSRQNARFSGRVALFAICHRFYQFSGYNTPTARTPHETL